MDQCWMTSNLSLGVCLGSAKPLGRAIKLWHRGSNSHSHDLGFSIFDFQLPIANCSTGSKIGNWQSAFGILSSRFSDPVSTRPGKVHRSATLQSHAASLLLSDQR